MFPICQVGYVLLDLLSALSAAVVFESEEPAPSLLHHDQVQKAP